MIKLALLFLLGAMTTVAQAQSEGAPATGAAPETPPAEATAAPTEVAPVPDAAPDAAEVPPPPPTAAAVHVIVENVESSTGKVWLALCNMDLSVEGCPYKISVPAAAGFVEATFEDIPPGDYAVAGFHDANGNDEFDKLIGVPLEPYALSGTAGDMLVPGFDDAVLPIALGPNDVVIRMKRLGG